MASKRRGVNGKSKGNRAERMAAGLFTDWSGQDFHRTPASGGLHWKQDNRVAGDIVSPDRMNFPFVVEVKSYRKGKLDVLDLANGQGLLPKFWAKVVAEAKGLGKVPILLFRCNNMPKDTFTALTYHNPMMVLTRTLTWSIRLKWRNHEELVMFDMMDMALTHEFDDFCKLARRTNAK